MVNALSLAWGPLLSSLEDQSPRARRERFAAFFYGAALLHEGLHTAQSLGAHFRELPVYKARIAPLLGDPQVQQLRSELLDKIRDELVFHFDRDTIAQGLTHFSNGETLIATTTDTSHGQTYFDLADDAILGYLFGADTPDEYMERLAGFMARTTTLFNRFIASSHSLIATVLSDMGCFMKPVERPAPPQDDAG